MQTIEAGFPNSVHNAQQCFRQILKALSEPGSQVTLEHHLGFAPLNAAASQVVMSLCDQQTALYLSAALTKNAEQPIEQALHNLAFHNGLSPAPINQADFVVLDAQEELDLSQLKAGTDSSPEQSATVLIQTNSLHTGPVFQLSGPGIKHKLDLQLGDLSTSIVDYLLKPSHRFPLGLDFMFCHQQSLVAISRTTKLELR
ncbi:phosphonate C-P lyase system protein PhnH [Agarivorans aestuarii]|uniref:phosphonate C-P lyase system protein PhnH n=1 Tax=Agarivorans aestuarii TaxID=1563703 RepID=UPI001C80D96B|nr:phosphonate C-P lyase system protein PhnH [Agarivorans aestuarii]